MLYIDTHTCSIHVLYLCIYIYTYRRALTWMQHFCPWQIKFESLESHMLLVYQFLMKGFPIMKSLCARHPHKSPHNHTLHVPAKMNDSVLIIEGSLNRNFRQYGELKSSSRVVKSVDRRCNSQKVRRKKIHPRQMLEKSRNAVFFHRFVCRVSPKVGLLKRRVRR